MRPANKSISITYLRPFLASAMIAGGLVNLAAPIYAAGTAAGADISNTATASYDDANGGPTSYTVSNTVKVTVEKIAGITITGEGFTDTTAAGEYKPNDLVTFNFKITNTGNSAVNFTIPGDAIVSTAGILQSVQYLPLGLPDVAGNWVTVTKGSAITPTDAVPVDGFLKARVIVKIDPNAKANDPLSVQLGKTAQAPTTTTPVTNADRAGNSDATDVFTVDILNLASAPGAAINGTREASAIQSVGVQAVNKAFTDITLTGSAPTPAAVPTNSKITYDLSVSVNTTAPTTGVDANKNPTDLGGSPILLDTTGTGTSSPANRVIISDVVPAGTTPTRLTAPAPTPGVTWLPVYSTSPAGTAPDLVQWKVVPVGGLPTTGVTFVGFVKSDDQPLPMSATPYTGFKIEVQTTGADLVNPTTFTNIANIFGSTPLSTGLGDPTNLVSDQTGTPTVDTITGGTPVSTTLTPTNTLGILNGPLSAAAATGADGSTNTDFTNKSAQIRLTDATVTNPVTGALTPLAAPQPVGFSNTVKNTGTAPTKVYLLPSVPAVATDLPAGTLVKITYGAESLTYTYVITGSVGSYTVSDATKLPISTASIAAGTTDAYGVSVTLPAGTPQLQGYSAPITAFVGGVTTAGILTPPSGASTNVTIDNVYTGFINLKKDARILTSAADAGASETAIPFSSSTLAVKPLPGQFIQYRVKYNNITTANGSSGSGNSLLNAGSLSIVEDGVFNQATNPNTNWAATTTHGKGSAVDSKGGVITYSGGTTSNDNQDTTVQKYVVNLGATTVAPGESGNFTFLRQVKK